MNLLIVDDNLYIQQTIQKVVASVNDDSIHVKTANNYGDAMALISSQKFDVAYLDIHIDEDTKNKTGLELAAELNKANANVKIVMISAFPTYALKSFEVHPYDFIVKPIDLNYLKEMTEHLFNEVHSKKNRSSDITVQKEKLCVRTSKDLFLLPYSEILFIEKINKDIVIQTKEADHNVRWNLNELETILPDYFIRVHKSYIVNIHKVCKVSKIGDRTYEMFFENINKTALMSRYKADQVFEILGSML